MKRLTKGQKNVLEVGAGASLVVGLVTVGIVVGVAARKIGEKLGFLRGGSTALMSGDSVVDAARDL